MTRNAHGRSLATALWGSALRERPTENLQMLKTPHYAL
jgi:hypothetical protein